MLILEEPWLTLNRDAIFAVNIPLTLSGNIHGNKDSL